MYNAMPKKGYNRKSRIKCKTCPYRTEDCDKIYEIEVNTVVKKECKSTTSHNNTDSLCWCCSKVYDGCKWSRCKKPVDGWEATEHLIDGNVCYNVKTCPEFERDVSKLREWEARHKGKPIL